MLMTKLIHNVAHEAIYSNTPSVFVRYNWVNNRKELISKRERKAFEERNINIDCVDILLCCKSNLSRFVTSFGRSRLSLPICTKAPQCSDVTIISNYHHHHHWVCHHHHPCDQFCHHHNHQYTYRSHAGELVCWPPQIDQIETYWQKLIEMRGIFTASNHHHCHIDDNKLWEHLASNHHHHPHHAFIIVFIKLIEIEGNIWNISEILIERYNWEILIRANSSIVKVIKAHNGWIVRVNAVWNLFDIFLDFLFWWSLNWMRLPGTWNTNVWMMLATR